MTKMPLNLYYNNDIIATNPEQAHKPTTRCTHVTANYTTASTFYLVSNSTLSLETDHDFHESIHILSFWKSTTSSTWQGPLFALRQECDHISQDIIHILPCPTKWPRMFHILPWCKNVIIFYMNMLKTLPMYKNKSTFYTSARKWLHFT